MRGPHYDGAVLRASGQEHLAVPEFTRRSLIAGATSLPFLAAVGQAQPNPRIMSVDMAFAPIDWTSPPGQTVPIPDEDRVRHTFLADS